MRRSSALAGAWLLALSWGAAGLVPEAPGEAVAGTFVRTCVEPCPATSGIEPEAGVALAPCTVPPQGAGVLFAGGGAAVARVSAGTDFVWVGSPILGSHVPHPPALFVGNLCIEPRQGYSVVRATGTLSW